MTNGTKSVHARISPEQWAKLQKRARKNNRSLTKEFKDILETVLGKEQR